MTSILVTGGAGFIGTNFVRYATGSQKYKIVVIDNLTYAGNLDGIEGLIKTGKIDFHKCDINNTELVEHLLKENNISKVIHFAAESHVDNSINNPEKFVEANVSGTVSMLEAVKKVWHRDFSNKRFHHVSTDEIFGSLSTADPAFKEESQYLPNSPYSASKAASNHFVRAYSQTFDLPISISNCSNNYGPYQHREKLIPKVVINALLGCRIPLYGDGQNVRDWMYVGDHCQILLNIMSNSVGIGKVYNIGGKAEVQNIELLYAICKTLEALFIKRPFLKEKYPNCPLSCKGGSVRDLIENVPDRLGHDLRYSIDMNKYEKEFGCFQHKKLSQGIMETIEWYIDNKGWWHEA